MGLQREFEDRGQRDEQAEEEDDREQVSHSFSPIYPQPNPQERLWLPGRRYCSLFVPVSSGRSSPKRAEPRISLMASAGAMRGNFQTDL
jgi:hypothetical protein